MQLNTKLEDYLESKFSTAAQGRDLRAIIARLAASAARFARKISRNALVDGHNSRELAVFGLFGGGFRDTSIGMLISESFQEPLPQNPDSNLALVINPLGSADAIEAALPYGSIFSIHHFDGKARVEDFSGASLLAAGLFVHGPQTRLVLSCGMGTSIFTLNLDSSEFQLSRAQARIPRQHREFAIDIANYRYWDGSIRHFFDDCVAGTDGPLGVDFKLHWNDSLLLETCRILTGGGVYIYPGDARPGFENGKHRLLHEALPIAFLVEQAGGKAADGFESIRDRYISQVEARTPLIFGAADAVDQVLEYFSGDPTETTRFPLFENRSLFRN